MNNNEKDIKVILSPGINETNVSAAEKALGIIQSKFPLLSYRFEKFMEGFGLVFPYDEIRVCICESFLKRISIFLLTKKEFDECYDKSLPKPILLDANTLNSLVYPQRVITVEWSDIE